MASNTHTHTPTQPPAFALPANPEKAVSETIKTIEQLHDIYLRENETLQKSNTQGFLALQQDKLQTAQIYQARINEILRRKDEMKNVSPSLKTKLQDMQAQFSETSKKNLEEIKRMQRTVDRLGGTIRKAAQDAARRQRGYSYGENGQIEGENKRSVSMGISETA